MHAVVAYISSPQSAHKSHPPSVLIESGFTCYLSRPITAMSKSKKVKAIYEEASNDIHEKVRFDEVSLSQGGSIK